MSQISVKNLSFEYDRSYGKVFENVSFQIDTNWKLGFIGRNGRGKTTFLKLLMGKYEYTGEINAPDVMFDYYPYHIPDETELAVNIIYNISDNAELWRIKREAALLGVLEETLYRPFAELSGGERTKIMLIGLFLKQDSFLLIDEPTNHLDTIGRKKVSEYLKNKKSFILVSHDRSFIDNCVDHILSINKMNIEVQKGNFSSWWENKTMNDSFEAAQNAKLKKDIKKLEESARRTAKWSDSVEKSKYGVKNSGLKQDRGFVGHKSAKMMKRSKVLEARKAEAVNEKSSLLKNVEVSERLSIKPLAHHSNKLVEVNGVSIHYSGRTACESVSFSVNQGERVLVTGKNGAGKSSLLKLVAGESIAFTGSLSIAAGVLISDVPQDTSSLSGSLKEYAEINSLNETLFKSALRKLDFSRELLDGEISGFSGGQKKKVLLAKSLCENAHIYIWDEPLNFIDVLSRIQIEELILDYKPTMLFVEHDERFAKKIATKEVYL